MSAGRIEVIVGSMFSGKTEELIRRVRRAQLAKQRVQVFKPEIDIRYSKEEVTSHNDSRMHSIVVSRSRDIIDHLEDNTRVVAIDEAQFFDEDIVKIVQKLADRGLRVIIAGLDMNWKAEPFHPIPALMAIAEEVVKEQAICMVCGKPASRTQKLIAGDNQIHVGAGEAYEARCRGCHEVNISQMSGLFKKSMAPKDIAKSPVELT